MNDIAIKVENLSKLYKIGARQEAHKTLRESIMGALTAPWRRLKRISQFAIGRQTSTVNNQPSDTIWALKDVSFKIEQGEVVGIIGGNGAGKTTLLKILSRITEPTEGRGEIYGRVGSLLEVGTGFHPELTGRENIYLNGAILGMKKSEIQGKFDQIVAFAEIEKFMDTPVKRYSSGMYVRLAFAVAAHLEPEILLVDEVLAVGDAAFQKKCIGKMGEVASEGRTVLFVSHNMPSVEALCTRVILIQNGQLLKDDKPSIVISHYLSQGVVTEQAEAELSHHSYRTESREPALQRVWLTNDSGERTNSICMGDSLTISFEFLCNQPISRPRFGFGIDDEHGRRIFTMSSYMLSADGATFEALRTGIATCRIQKVILLPGRYMVSVAIVEDGGEIVDFVERAIALDVHPADVFGSGRIPKRSQGIVFVHGEITVEATENIPEAASKDLHGAGDSRAK